MGQITIYLDSETEKRLTSVIKNGGVSKSRWIADLIKEKIATNWPENVVALAGAWSDLPAAEEIRDGAGKDVERELL
jgi:hypothetical protein